MKTKSLEWVRIAIYTVLACLGLWIPIWIFDCNIATSTDPTIAFVMLFAGCSPAFANLFTRLLTKEGFHDSFLHFNFPKAWKWYIIAPILNLLIVSFGDTCACFVFREKLEAAEEAMTRGDICMILLSGFATVLLFALYTLGEELGWRGYMMPRLEKRIGTVPSIIVGGIIWGIWHGPLFQYGYNFGTNYPLFPYLGIALMCANCIGTNAIYTWLTKRTGTVYVSSLAHSCNNALNGILASFIFLGKTIGEDNLFYFALVQLLFELPFFILFTILCIKHKPYEMP